MEFKAGDTALIVKVPEAAEPLVRRWRLTEDVVARWPEAPPYGGVHDAIVPHLTLGHGVVVDEAAVAAALPLAARVTGVSMLVREDDEFWQETEFFPFA
ncbi:hypothetical protein [Nonomuraea sp. NPDC049709]|uniref:hypothetical protein n=1 Tax=Nonomuraea sp. NPDC049709 TaxID=3154736 RepID=UPI003413A7AF